MRDVVCVVVCVAVCVMMCCCCCSCALEVTLHVTWFCFILLGPQEILQKRTVHGEQEYQVVRVWFCPQQYCPQRPFVRNRFIRAHAHTHAHTHTHTHTHTQAHLHIHSLTLAHTSTHKNTHTHTPILYFVLYFFRSGLDLLRSRCFLTAHLAKASTSTQTWTRQA